MQLEAHLASQPWILITLVIKYEYFTMHQHYAQATASQCCSHKLHADKLKLRLHKRL